MIDLKKYDYHLPPELIRKQGVEPRDNARLFVYDTVSDTITHTRFFELANFLPAQSLLVLNNTKVVPARLWLHKPTGGKIEAFVLANEIREEGEIPFLTDRRCEIGWRLFFPNQNYFEVVRQEKNKFFARLHSEETLATLLNRYGETPIPHYLEDKAEHSKEERNKREQHFRLRYQTVFAAEGASVAAPTASLHFTDRVFASLDSKQIARATVTLNVGLGTFALLKDEHFATGKLHQEYIEVPQETALRANDAKQSGRPVIPVGTTALRTLESVGCKGTLRAYRGATDIFIYPPYQFRIADGLVTNFHLPQSSLMLLVDALLQHKGARRSILDLYQTAIAERYAFYSFGDSMLIL